MTTGAVVEAKNSTKAWSSSISTGGSVDFKMRKFAATASSATSCLETGYERLFFYSANVRITNAQQKSKETYHKRGNVAPKIGQFWSQPSAFITFGKCRARHNFWGTKRRWGSQFGIRRLFCTNEFPGGRRRRHFSPETLKNGHEPLAGTESIRAFASEPEGLAQRAQKVHLMDSLALARPPSR